MASDNDSRDEKPETEDPSALGSSSIGEVPGDSDIERVEVSEERATVTQLGGAQRYVHAAFFVLAMLTAYVFGKLLLGLWNALADVPAAARAVPQLIQYGEDERASYALVLGAILGALVVLHYFKKPSTRAWADEVAGELARVTWPNRETVMNGAVVVLIAGAMGTVYVALLDRFWGYLTNLVYGA